MIRHLVSFDQTLPIQKVDLKQWIALRLSATRLAGPRYHLLVVVLVLSEAQGPCLSLCPRGLKLPFATSGPWWLLTEHTFVVVVLMAPRRKMRMSIVLVEVGQIQPRVLLRHHVDIAPWQPNEYHKTVRQLLSSCRSRSYTLVSSAPRFNISAFLTLSMASICLSILAVLASLSRLRWFCSLRNRSTFSLCFDPLSWIFLD